MAFNVYRDKTYTQIKEREHDELCSSFPVYSDKDKVLIIDADILAFRVSSVCEYKYIFKKDNEEYKVKSITAFKEYCAENNLEYESFTCEKKQFAEPESYLYKTLTDSINKVMEFCGCNKVELYIGGSNNFRDNLSLPIQYKSSRTEAERPLLLTKAKEYLIRYKKAYKITGEEADDIIQYRLRDLYHKNVRCFVYTVDKDIYQNIDYDIRVYDPMKEDIILSDGGVGVLKINSYNKVKGTGLKWLVFQTMLGDEVDSYSPKQFFLKKYGDKSFYKDFNDLKTEKEVLENFINKWRSLLPEKITYTSFDGSFQEHDWLSLAELYYQCAKMRDDTFLTLESLFKHYDVEYNN